MVGQCSLSGNKHHAPLNDFLHDLKIFLEGRQEGEAIMLTSLLELRFGPLNDEIKQRIADTEGAILLAYAKRLLDAEKLEDVFEINPKIKSLEIESKQPRCL